MKQIVVASAHKVGSTWLTNILRKRFDNRYHLVPKKYRLNENIKVIIDLNSTGISTYLASLDKIHVFKTHCLPPTKNNPVWSEINAINIYRDPRNMAVSNAFYLANLAPELGGWEKLQAMNIQQRIRQYLEIGLYDLELLEAWLACKNTIDTTYENMLEYPNRCIEEILRQINVPANEENIVDAIAQFSFQKMSNGRNPGDQREASFYRKGISGDWKNYFSDSLKQHFKSIHNGRWNEVLINLGYVSSIQW